MKYCTKCGKEIMDDAQFCPFCAASQTLEVEVVRPREEKSTLKLVAFIFAIITTISTGWFLIPLIWCIPMTVYIYQAYQGNRKLGTGFKVCTLLFLNIVSGILLLVDKD